ncbi:transmembrane protein 223 [Rhincodon typus]|uniref:transmembrane protein 223 n=1 Tax=Rhincodon typus TaxID=259920 RepID=UPI00202E522F|nr:transmembrane protein 223 [Rhincodon typus]
MDINHLGRGTNAPEMGVNSLWVGAVMLGMGEPSPGLAERQLEGGWDSLGTVGRAAWSMATMMGSQAPRRGIAWPFGGGSIPVWAMVGSRPMSGAPAQDVVLFCHERTSFFRLLGLFCLAQFLFWTYLAHFAFTSLKDTGYQETVLEGEQASGLPKIGGLTLNLGSDGWRYGFTTSCLIIGSSILGAGSLFARRSVSRVVLHRGGQQVTIASYLPFGRTSSFTVPLHQVSCVAHRTQVPSMVPLRIRGHRFYYLLDKQGQFYNAKLFDTTIGAYRKL